MHKEIEAPRDRVSRGLRNRVRSDDLNTSAARPSPQQVQAVSRQVGGYLTSTRDVEALTDDLEVFADWLEKVGAGLRRLDLLQSLDLLTNEQIDAMAAKVANFKAACSVLIESMRRAQ